MIIMIRKIIHLTWLLATLLQSMYKNKITWKLNGLICCGKAITAMLKALCLVKINVLKYLKDAIILWLHLSASLKILHLPIVWSVDNYCCMKKSFRIQFLSKKPHWENLSVKYMRHNIYWNRTHKQVIMANKCFDQQKSERANKIVELWVRID